MGGKQRIMALYQTQPDRSLRAKALAKEYGIGGHSHDYLDGSRGFVNHDWKGLEFDHYPDHQKITLKWAQVEQYIDLMIQSDRYLTDKEKEHYTPPAPVNAEPDVELARAKNLIREFCQEEYDSEPDFSNLSKIGVAYTHATDEDIPIQVNVDLVGYRVERYLGEVLIDERQYESLEDLTETELEALDFSELVSVTDEELEHYHSKVEERPALLPLDAATEYNALKEQHPDALVGFEQNGYYEFYADDAQKVSERLGGKLLEKETALGTVPVIGFPRDQWAYRAKQLWQCGENIYLAGLNEDGTHHQTKYLRREDYLPLGITIHMEGRYVHQADDSARACCHQRGYPQRSTGSVHRGTRQSRPALYGRTAGHTRRVQAHYHRTLRCDFQRSRRRCRRPGSRLATCGRVSFRQCAE